MASTFSPSLRIELIGDGDQSGIWGQTTNNNLGGLIEQAIGGVVSINLADANYTLSNFNGVVDEARNAVLVATGTLSAQRNIIAPVVEKTYTIRNNTTGGFGVQIIGSSGTGVVIPNGQTISVYCDGTNFLPLNTGAAGNFSVSGNLAVTGSLGGSTATFSGAISSVSPTFTGTPTAPTAAPGTNTTQIATTAYATAAITALGLGTMSTQNANAVAITGGSISGLGSAIPAASGGTGLTAPGASGNVLTSNGTAWTSAAASLATSSIAFFGPASFVGTITATTLTVTSMNYGFINIGNTIFGTGITGSPAIASQTSGTTGGVGVYVLSVSQGVLSSFTMNNGTGTGTFVVPALVASLKATLSGGGGGGGGSAFPGYSGATAGTAGGQTSFGSLMTCTGGGGGGPANGDGGTGTAGTTGKSPQAVYAISPNFINTDGSGGNYGAGGSGGQSDSGESLNSGGVGGKSITSIASITVPAAGTSITVTIGGAGAGGNAGTFGQAGAAGTQGFCLLEW